MHVFIPKETHPGETRVSMTPEAVARLVKRGLTVTVEKGLGLPIGAAASAYKDAGAQIARSRAASLKSADMVLRLRRPPAGEIKSLKKGCIHVSFLDPFNEAKLVAALVKRGVGCLWRFLPGVHPVGPCRCTAPPCSAGDCPVHHLLGSLRGVRIPGRCQGAP